MYKTAQQILLLLLLCFLTVALSLLLLLHLRAFVLRARSLGGLTLRTVLTVLTSQLMTTFRVLVFTLYLLCLAYFSVGSLLWLRLRRCLRACGGFVGRFRSGQKGTQQANEKLLSR